MTATTSTVTTDRVLRVQMNGAYEVLPYKAFLGFQILSLRGAGIWAVFEMYNYFEVVRFSGYPVQLIGWFVVSSHRHLRYLADVCKFPFPALMT